MSAAVALIVGLGNPGPEYEDTRHNAGFWFVDAVAADAQLQFKPERRFHAEAARLNLQGSTCWLLKPQTFMNRSGMAVAAFARYYDIPPEAILVAHDELDFAPGTVRIKRGGGHAGHNGLRDLIAHLGSRDFLRLRLGIDHPGVGRDVANYVLSRPSRTDRDAVDQAIDAARSVLPLLLAGKEQQAIHRLHAPAQGGGVLQRTD